MMTLDDYAHKMRRYIDEFEEEWKLCAKADPKAHPLEMADTDWDEQLDDYVREQRDRDYARRAAMRRARGVK